MTDDCLDNPERRHGHRCPYYDHDTYSCDRHDCAHHDPPSIPDEVKRGRDMTPFRQAELAVIAAAQDVLDTKPGGVWHNEALRQLRVAMSALAACAPDEVNEADGIEGFTNAEVDSFLADHRAPSAPDEVNEAET